jgi:DNA-3-methyladenine glycosylase II
MMDKLLLSTTDEIVQALSITDEVISKLIKKIGNLDIALRKNYFESLVMSIIGQQLSSKAAGTIRSRVKMLCPDISPQQLRAISMEQLRSAGVSRAKITYIHDLCDKMTAGEIVFGELDKLNNDAVIKTLTKVKGIGKWTAEMFLIFSLGRTNVLSFADAGLQRAAKWLYDIPYRPDGKYLEQKGDLWSPYQSIASLYLWEAIDCGFVDSGKTSDELLNG